MSTSVYPAAGVRVISQLDDVYHVCVAFVNQDNERRLLAGITEIDNIEHFCSPIVRHTREQLSICTSGHGNDGGKVSPVMLDKLDAGFLLFPQLQMPIHGSGDQETCPGNLR